MRAEDTLQFMADFYSDLFPTRKHALDFLFNVVGNGYEWVKGELVDKDDEFEKRYKLRKPIEKAIFRKAEGWLSAEDTWKRMEAVGIHETPPLAIFNWTTPGVFTTLCTVPKDITDDWKHLIEECLSLMKADGVDIDAAKCRIEFSIGGQLNVTSEQ